MWIFQTDSGILFCYEVIFNRTLNLNLLFSNLFNPFSLTFLPNECDFDALIELASEHREQMEAECPGCWSTLFDSTRPHSSHAVELWDNSTGIYKVFYLLVDGVTCCLTHTKDPVQKAIGEVVMATLTLLVDIRG